MTSMWLSGTRILHWRVCLSHEVKCHTHLARLGPGIDDAAIGHRLQARQLP